VLVGTRLAHQRFFGRGQGELVKTSLPLRRSLWMFLRRGELVKTGFPLQGFWPH
jgi:hypothetical protein